MSLIVEVKQGKLQGKENNSVLTGKPYYSFQGIPYSEPPLRFQVSEPKKPWEGTYDATYERDICLQFNDFLSQIQILGSEDCLYLNVNTPQIPSNIKTPIPVMVYIHGGGFYFGSGSEKIRAADFLIRHDVILVTFNYRLHILGFLNLGIPGCPGNVGLKDQLLALKWVKENIAKFGGDPENITIFGESAGATSVHYQTITPLSKGLNLFKKAILQSGSVLSNWALMDDPCQIGLEFGRKLGFKGEDKEKLLDFLKQQDANTLIETIVKFREDFRKRELFKYTDMAFVPSVESIKDGAFLPDLPQKLLKIADPLPIIYGANSVEGVLILFMPSKEYFPLISKDFSLVLSKGFRIEPKNVIPDLAEKVKKHYFGDKEATLENWDEMSNLFTDIFFYYFYEAIENVTKSSMPVYVYEFKYSGSFNMVKKVIECQVKKEIKRACHADELGYLFYQKELTQVPPIEGNDLKVINNITTLWTNFAKSGIPSDELKWKPSTQSEPSYLLIDVEPKVIKETIYGERLQFLKNLLDPYVKPSMGL